MAAMAQAKACPTPALFIYLFIFSTSRRHQYSARHIGTLFLHYFVFLQSVLAHIFLYRGVGPKLHITLILKLYLQYCPCKRMITKTKYLNTCSRMISWKGLLYVAYHRWVFCMQLKFRLITTPLSVLEIACELWSGWDGGVETIMLLGC